MLWNDNKLFICWKKSCPKLSSGVTRCYNRIEEVKKKFSETVGTQHVGLYKKGFRNWKVILYGAQAYYQVIVTEDGKILSSERLEYK